LTLALLVACHSGWQATPASAKLVVHTAGGAQTLTVQIAELRQTGVLDQATLLARIPPPAAMEVTGVSESVAAAQPESKTLGSQAPGPEAEAIEEPPLAPAEAAEIKSIDICHPKLARPFVAADKLTALCMPCNVLIYREKGVTRLAAMRPGVMMPQLFAQAADQLGDLPARIDSELRAILEAGR